MKVNEAIAEANELRLNTLDDTLKEAWLRSLDGQILEMMQLDEDAQEHEAGTWPDAGIWPEADPDLLLPAPHDMVYVYHLIAQIDYRNQEIALYTNDMAFYNAAMRDARAWWRRNHTPKYRGNWRVM